jgi:hypothetical protein
MQSSGPVEEDFPKGHPGRADYDPNSPEAFEWVRKNVSPLGERDFPVDHPKAADTPGNLNSLTWRAGEDPLNPHREPFTGRTPEQAAGVAKLSMLASVAAKESPVVQPLDAIEVSAALNVKRKEVGRDVLTPEEYSAVMANLQTRPRAGEDPEAVAHRISLQHQALAVLLGRGFTRQTALEMIARDGAEKVLAQHPAE